MERRFNVNLKNNKIDYDNLADVLYLTFGRTSKNEELDSITECDLVRFDKNSKRIIGITIIGYFERFHIKPEYAFKKVVPDILRKFETYMFGVV